ncbi:MAG: hypothetical protein N2C14_25515, partial [Planctomycetales bacterium]
RPTRSRPHLLNRARSLDHRRGPLASFHVGRDNGMVLRRVPIARPTVFSLLDQRGFSNVLEEPRR